MAEICNFYAHTVQKMDVSSTRLTRIEGKAALQLYYERKVKIKKDTNGAADVWKTICSAASAVL